MFFTQKSRGKGDSFEKELDMKNENAYNLVNLQLVKELVCKDHQNVKLIN